jgi:hypothetical protein
VPQREDNASHTDITGPLEPGARVSLELPDSGTCVALIVAKHRTTIELDLLDDLPDDELRPGLPLDLFMPRTEGIYHWLCELSSLPVSQRVEIELLGLPVFVQRRLGQRVEAELQAEVRRISAARRGRPHEMRVADLSRGGMKLEGPFQLSTGDTLEITVGLGSAVQVMGRAVMAYRTSEGTWTAHVSFLDGQRDSIDVVASYVAHRFRRRPT